uniref:RAB38c, member of RAS oncogene family n=1 Tax=Oncorhynchus mykiss TaxID=8022 RepID=A0A8K9V9U1_ONCMY
MQQEHLLKLLVIADLGVSKTSVKSYVHQIFSQHYRATIDVDFALKVLHWDSDSVIRLQLWDIARQERYCNMTRVCYRTVGALGVFDMTHVTHDLSVQVVLSSGRTTWTLRSPSVMANLSQLWCWPTRFVGWFETSAKVREGDNDTDRETLQLTYCSPPSLSQLPLGRSLCTMVSISYKEHKHI